jgi:hypothetical protein
VNSLERSLRNQQSKQMNKPNKMSLSEYRRSLTRSAEGASASFRAVDSDRLSMYFLGLEVAFLIAAVRVDRIDVSIPDPYASRWTDKL